jgi:hypothetical protein
MQLPHETIKQMLQKRAFDYQETDHQIIIEQKGDSPLKPLPLKSPKKSRKTPSKNTSKN